MEAYSKSYPIEGRLIGGRKENVEFKQIAFTGVLVDTDLGTTKSFNIQDQVWMVMNDTYENATFVVSTRGIIFKDPERYWWCPKCEFSFYLFFLFRDADVFSSGVYVISILIWRFF